MTEVVWLLNGLIPVGMISLLIGDPGLGKSLWTAWLAARVTKDGGDVLFLSAEDAPDAVVKPRLRAAGAHLGLVHELTVRVGEDNLGLVFPDDVDMLIEATNQVAAQLIIIDPVTAHLPADINAFRDQDIRRALRPLARLAEETGAAVLLVAHLNKGAGTDALKRTGGSMGLPGISRSMMLMARDPEQSDGDTRVLAHVKSNVGPYSPSIQLEVYPTTIEAGNDEPEVKTARIEPIGESKHGGASLLQNRGDNGDEHGALADAVVFVEDELADGPIESKKLAEAARDAGISPRTLERARAQLGVKPHRLGGRGTPWIVSLEFKDRQDRQANDVAVLAVFENPLNQAKNHGSDFKDRQPNTMAVFENGKSLVPTIVQVEGLVAGINEARAVGDLEVDAGWWATYTQDCLDDPTAATIESLTAILATAITGGLE